jgi:hypothetical protein
MGKGCLIDVGVAGEPARQRASTLRRGGGRRRLLRPLHAPPTARAGVLRASLRRGRRRRRDLVLEPLPGARCDIPTTDYTFTFDPELDSAWTWSEKYAAQPEILAYLGFIADRYDLRPDIEFATSITATRWDEATGTWTLTTDRGQLLGCRYYINGAASASRLKQLSEDPGRFGTKRPCLDSGYFETYNLPDVRLVDLRAQPISAITEAGIDTTAGSFEFDVLVYATGFDAMTGPLAAVDITGKDGLSLTQKWSAGPATYLGLMTAGFPNLFMITGPGSPSVLSNMAVSIEQHVEWIAGCLAYLRVAGFETIEPTALAESGWGQHVQGCAAITLHPTARSWYMGANVPGKPRVFLPYIGGVDAYRRACDEVVSRGYLGFRLCGPGARQSRDGVIRSMHPDVAMVLRVMAEMGLPPVDLTRPSYAENGEGYVLTSGLMGWFWNHYAVPVRHVRARGHIHSSVTMVGVIISGAPVRAKMAEALTGFFGAAR